MKHLHYISFLDSLSLGNDPRYIKLNDEIRSQLSEIDIGTGRFNPNTEQTEQLIGEPIETIKPFVFSLFDSSEIETVEPEEELSLPFRATWIETFERPLVSQMIHGQIEVNERGTISILPTYHEELSASQVIRGRKVRVQLSLDMVGALIIESENPKEAYPIVMHQEMRLFSVNPDDHGEKLFEALRQKYGERPVTVENYAGMIYHTMANGTYSALGPEGKLYRAAQYLFTSMRKSSAEAGTIRVDAKAKVGTGKNRRLMRIKDLVVVAPKKQKSVLAEHIGARREIDWSHRWDVMGHWRKIAGIGKDRNGSYTVKGYTWVIPHTKGPEDKVLIRKTRFVSGDE